MDSSVLPEDREQALNMVQSYTTDMSDSQVYSSEFIMDNLDRAMESEAAASSEDISVPSAESQEPRHHHTSSATARVPPNTLLNSTSSSLNSSSQLRKKKPRRRSSNSSSSGGRKISRIRPSKALVRDERTTVDTVVSLMVERRQQAVLLTDSEGNLSGILTDTDIACRVVASGLNPSSTIVYDVMTRSPSCVSSRTTAMTALRSMVSGNFRHLPVADNGNVVGLLDITKVLFDVISRIEKAYDLSSEKFTRAVEKLEQEVGGVGGANTLFETMRQKLFMPTLDTLLDSFIIPRVFENATTLEASLVMLSRNVSGVMVYNTQEESVGIFTSKDLLRRTLAAGYDPATTLVSDAMTRNPDVAFTNTTIVDALHAMHDGKFLHLPILNNEVEKKVVGLTDVLQVTYGVVNQMGSLQQASDETSTPVWRNFWSSVMARSDSIRQGSGAYGGCGSSTIGSARSESSSEDEEEEKPPAATTPSNILPAVSLSRSSTNSEYSSHQCYPDLFKYKITTDKSTTTHLFTSSGESVAKLLLDVKTRLKRQDISVLNYTDEEGDAVILLNDEDLKDAVASARASGQMNLKLSIPKKQEETTAKADTNAANRRKEQQGLQYAAAVALAGAVGVMTLAFTRKN